MRSRIPTTESLRPGLALLALVLIALGGPARGAPPPTVVVPDAVGAEQTDARRRIGSAGLQWREEKAEVSDPAQFGRVVSQSPRAGEKVAKGSEVRLSYGTPGTQIRVPSVRNLTRGEAEQVLGHAKLFARYRFPGVPTNDAAALGKVAAQETAAGALVPRGAEVWLQLYVRDEVKVPGVVGMTEAQAVAAIQKAGLVPEVKRASPEPGRTPGMVRDQEPRVDVAVARGKTVKIVVNR